MNNNTQVIPVGKPYVYVDEPAEFRGLENQTEARKQQEAAKIEADMRERNRQRREARNERRRILRNCKLLILGMIATCCGISAVLAWRSAYPVLSLFPAALSLISITVGVRS